MYFLTRFSWFSQSLWNYLSSLQRQPPNIDLYQRIRRQKQTGMQHSVEYWKQNIGRMQCTRIWSPYVVNTFKNNGKHFIWISIQFIVSIVNLHNFTRISIVIFAMVNTIQHWSQWPNPNRLWTHKHKNSIKSWIIPFDPVILYVLPCTTLFFTFSIGMHETHLKMHTVLFRTKKNANDYFCLEFLWWYPKSIWRCFARKTMLMIWPQLRMLPLTWPVFGGRATHFPS